MTEGTESAGASFRELDGIMRRLRAPGGCPWDREQTLETLRTYIIEEAYELVDAITDSDIDGIIEESGDLFLQPLFVATIANEKGLFSIEDVIESLKEKLIRRHPHVFADAEANTSDEVLKNWEKIKSREKKSDKRKGASVLSGVPKNLPALVKAYRIQEKAANVGFDWSKDDLKSLFGKIDEEIDELKEALHNGDSVEQEDEMGDIFFALVNLARHLDLNPEVALQKACSKFGTRFMAVEGKVVSSGRSWDSFTLEELDELWESSKREIAEDKGKLASLHTERQK